MGARELLSAESIGVVGSRAVSGEGEAIAREIGERVVRDGLALVSGGAKGVDRRAMSAAHEAGGRVVGYLAESLLRRVREPSARRALADGTSCFATPFDPSARFSAAHAIGRNKLIYASARVTVVVASELDRGGTWEGATEALREGTDPSPCGSVPARDPATSGSRLSERRRSRTSPRCSVRCRALR